MSDKLSKSSSDFDLLGEKRRLDEDTGGVGPVGQDLLEEEEEEEDIRSNLKSSSSNFDDDEDINDDFDYDDDDLNGEYLYIYLSRLNLPTTEIGNTCFYFFLF